MSYISLVEQSTTPATPPTGKSRIFINTGGTVSSVDDAGVVTTYSAGITQEQVEDYVGNLLADSSTVNVTYNDAGNVVSFDVIVGSVDHDALLNFVANEHVDHSSVSINAGTGLTGGGDITATRTISMPNTGTAGTYKSVTTDAQGRVTAGTNPTTLAGYGITDAQPLDAELTAVAGLATNGLVTKTGAGAATTRSVEAGTYMSVTNGDGVSGNPTVAHANSAVTPGTYGSATQVPVVTIGATGHVDAISTAAVIGSEWNELITSADLTNASNTTLVNVTELGFTAVAGNKYYCEYTVRYRSSAANTGLALTLGTSNTAAGSVSAQVNIPVAADGTGALYTGSITAFDDVVTGTTTPAASPTDFIATMRAIFDCTTGGTFLPKFRSETNGNTVTFRDCSVALIREFTP